MCDAHVNSPLRSEKCHFWPFLKIFCLFSLGKGSEFFLENLTQKGFRFTYLNSLTHFVLTMHFCLVMLKKSFFPIFQYKLGFSEIPLTKDEKNIQGPLFALGNIPNHKIYVLRITKNHMTFWNGGCMGSLSGSQTICAEKNLVVSD